MTPFIISRLGTTGFGIWALASAFANYVKVLDLGLGAALVKFIAEYKAKEDDRQINILLNTYFVICLVMGALSFVLFLFLKEWIIVNFFNIGGGVSSHIGSGEFKNDIGFVLTGAILIFTANLTFSIFISLLNGLQRMDLTNIAAISSVIVNAIGTIIALNLGYGLRGLVIVNAIAISVAIIFNGLMSKIQFKALRINPFLFRAKYVKRLLGFSVQMQVVGLGGLVLNQLSKIILGYFTNLNYVAYFEAASNIINQIRAFPLMIINPIMPAASEIYAKRDFQRLYGLYYRALKYMVLFSAPLFIFIAVFAQPLVRLWLGPGYEMTALALQLLAIGNFINLLAGPGFLIDTGMGNPRYGAYATLIGIGLNMILGIALTMKFGYIGTILGIVIALTLGNFYLIVSFHTRHKISPQDTFWKALTRPLITCISGGVLFFFLERVAGGLKGILLAILTYTAFYIVVMLKSSYLDEYDISQLNHYARIAYTSTIGRLSG